MALRVTLPDNPAPEGFNCVRIYYPDDPGFLTAVLSVVRYLENWYSWERDDAKQGRIAAASFRKASIFTVRDILAGIGCGDCDASDSGDDTEPITITKYIGGYSGDDEEGEDVAVQRVTFDKATCELVIFYGGCCEERIKLTCGPINEDTEDIINQPDDAEYSACAKATATVETLTGVGITVWDQTDNDPVTAWNNLNLAWPGGIMSRGYFTNAWLAGIDLHGLVLVSGGLYGPDPFDETTWQAIKCQLAAWYTEDETVPDGDTIFNKVIGLIDAQWPLDPVVQSYWWNVYKTIGENDLRNFVVMNATQDDADCDCPELDYPGPTQPDVNGWYWSARDEWIIPASGSYNSKLCLPHAMPQDCFGAMYYFKWDAAAPIIKRMSCADAECGPVDNCAWGNTSEHNEYDGQEHIYATGNETVLDSLLGAGEYTLKTSNYGTPSNPASPTYPQATMVHHGFFADTLDPGESVTVYIRYLHNTNSPSHGS